MTAKLVTADIKAKKEEEVSGWLAGRNRVGLSMVVDSRDYDCTMAGIQVEAAANPKESSSWLPAPASVRLWCARDRPYTCAYACTHSHPHRYTRICIREIKSTRRSLAEL